MKYLSGVLAVLCFVVLAFTLFTLPDFMNRVTGFTPGVVARGMQYNCDGYRLNADSTVTFRDRWTDTWLTLPQDQCKLMPRRNWWWQRILPPSPTRPGKAQ